jgi:hypothetical protein
MLKNLLNKVFGEKNKDGKCRPWNHEMEYKPEYSLSNTGQFIDGKPIQTKYRRDISECKICGEKSYGDLNFCDTGDMYE